MTSTIYILIIQRADYTVMGELYARHTDIQ